MSDTVRPISSKMKKHVHDLLDKGLTASAIARALAGHVSYRSVHNWATAYRKSKDQDSN